MPKFVKKPYVIEAVKFCNKDFEHWEPWMQDGYDNKKWGYKISYDDGKTEGFFVETLEGTMVGGAGDYLVQGVEGELYICRGDIFEKTYEKVEG